jgi:hypothetical protein
MGCFYLGDGMDLYRVTLSVEKDWMSKPVDLVWAITGGSSDDAIKKVLEVFDMSGVKIRKAKAKKEDYIVIR